MGHALGRPQPDADGMGTQLHIQWGRMRLTHGVRAIDAHVVGTCLGRACTAASRPPSPTRRTPHSVDDPDDERRAAGTSQQDQKDRRAHWGAHRFRGYRGMPHSPQHSIATPGEQGAVRRTTAARALSGGPRKGRRHSPAGPWPLHCPPLASLAPGGERSVTRSTMDPSEGRPTP